jgi:hypothetical protein
MIRSIRCAHCRRLVPANPRVKNQRFCPRAACQRARKTAWQREKMATDSDYRANQRACQRSWQQAHPHYWQAYRRRRPGYRERNRRLQTLRDATRRRRRDLAKMDASEPISFVRPGMYYLIPVPSAALAKMDALSQKVHLIPAA